MVPLGCDPNCTRCCIVRQGCFLSRPLSHCGISTKWMQWYIWSPKSPNRRSLCIYPGLWLALYRDESAYVNFMNKHCLHWTYNTVRVQEEGSIVCGLHCIFYLIHWCAGHSMTDVTMLLENPVEATDIVQKFVLSLLNHVVWKKKKRK
jgi:hypothetical protein